MSGAVIVGTNNYTVDSVAYFLDFLVGESEDGSHSGGFELACFLHGLRTGGNQAETVFEGERAGCYEGREFAK